jgi:hypothetical protein
VSGTTTTQSIIPSTHNTYDLGTLANRFKSGYFNGTLVAISTYTNNLFFGVTNLAIYNSLGTQVLQFFGTGNLLLQNGGTFTDVASSILTLASTTKGFLPPRMTNAQRLAIATPAVGLIVYCTDVVEGLYINKSTGWTFVI